MSAVLETESTLTDRYQTTVPEPVRSALKLGKRDKIHYKIMGDGAVLLSRAQVADADDPALGSFLGFLARDIVSHPDRLQAIDPALVKRVQALVGGVEVNLDQPLAAADE